VPEVLLAVGAEDLAVVGDEVGRVVEVVWFCFFSIPVRGAVVFLFWLDRVFLDDRPWDDADVELLGEGLVCAEVFLVVAGLGGVEGVRGGPAVEVVSIDNMLAN